MIRICRSDEKETIYTIINEAAQAYAGAIPDDCYHQPYMSMSELEREMERMTFYGYEIDGELVGVMGLEPIKDTTLIRHAYILNKYQRQGIASKLLDHMKEQVTTPQLLVGTWADARWALDFYVKHGFAFMPDNDRLLKTYYDIPQRQFETSVVLGMDMK